MAIANLPASVRGRLSGPEFGRLATMFGFIAALHLIGFALLVAAASSHYRVGAGGATFGIGTGILAYTLGLRHAFDADHICAIDNTTRKLMADGGRPMGVGFFFALGHSTVVLLLAVLLNFGIHALAGQVRSDTSALHHYAGLVGTSLSAGFLVLIAVLNLVVLVSVVQIFVRLRDGRYDEAALEDQLNRRGLMNRFFGPLARSVSSSWRMYPIGILFGLGFETASEIALLVLAGAAVTGGLPFWAVLSLPALFAAGMTILDTLDGSFMNFAYSWAFSKPVRKVYYNITITGLSVVVAIFIGGLEVAQVLAGELGLKGGIWGIATNFDINRAGFVIVGLFVGVWVVALSIWHFGRVEDRWDAGRARSRR